MRPHALVIAALGCLTLLSACEENSAAPDGQTDTVAQSDAVSPPQADAAGDAGTPPDAGPPDAGPAVPSWRHDGPIRAGTPVAPSAPLFVEVGEATGLAALDLTGGRVYLVDLDGDGRDDLVTLPVTVPAPEADQPRALMTPRLVRNDGPDATGQVRFSDVTATSGFAGFEFANMVFGDVDNDGDQDVFTGVSFRSGSAGVFGIWFNDGAGHFTYAGPGGFDSPIVGTSSGQFIYKEMAALGFADLDRDGALDLYIGTWYAGDLTGANYAPTADELYRGDGLGGFQAVPLPDQHNHLTSTAHPSLTGVARAAYGLAMSDYDGDGDMDVFVNNYGAGRPAANSPPRYWDHNLLWRNDGDMIFTDVGATAGVAATTRGIGGVEQETAVALGGVTYPGPIGGNGFGCQFGDLDNDGDQDLVIGTIAHPDYPQSDRTMMHYNGGGAEPVFTEESAARGLQYHEDELHPALVDVDGDGRLDLAMSRLRGGSKWEVYLQGADGGFIQQGYPDSGVDITRPSATVWLDYDDDGDLDFFMPKGAGRLFENTAGQDNGAVVVRLSALAPRDATGARVTLRTGAGLQTREVSGGNGHYNSQLSRALTFGLGGDSGASALTIHWPDGNVQLLGDVAAGVRLHVVQAGAISTF